MPLVVLGTVHVPDGPSGDELMGTRAPWLGFTGVHDGHGRVSTLVMVDAPTNPTRPTLWFVRANPFTCICPAPLFDTELPVARGESVSLRYAVVIDDGNGSRAAQWAALGAASWQA